MTTKQRIDVPGKRDTPGKSTVIFDESVQSDFDALNSKQRELKSRLRTVDQEVAAILAGLGELVANDGDWRVESDRLADLRAEAEALEAGLDHLRGQSQLLKRLNSWL